MGNLPACPQSQTIWKILILHKAVDFNTDVYTAHNNSRHIQWQS